MTVTISPNALDMLHEQQRVDNCDALCELYGNSNLDYRVGQLRDFSLWSFEPN